MDSHGRLLNISEAAKMLGISPSTLRRLEQNGVIKNYGLRVLYSPGGQRRYLFDELQQLFTHQGFSGQIGFGQKAALLIRDFTLAFTEEASQLAIQMDEQIPTVRSLAEEAIRLQIPVIFTITIYDPTSRSSRLWIKKFPSLQILDNQSRWVKMHPDLEGIPYDLVHKTIYTTLYESPVFDFLNQRQIDTIILAGATTSGSIRATAVEALQRGFHVIIPKEAVGDRTTRLQETTLMDLNARYADVVSSEDVIEFFKQSAVQ